MTALSAFSGPVVGDVSACGNWMLVGRSTPDEQFWRPCVMITDEVSEVLWAFAHGRTIEGRRASRVDGKVGFREPAHITADDYTGLCCEYAVALYLGLPFELRYDPGNRFADLGDDIQVRGTTYLHGGLIIRPHERHKTDRHILGILHKKHVAIVGWMPGELVVATGADNGWWHENGYWLVPSRDTLPMPEFARPEPAPLRWP